MKDKILDILELCFRPIILCGLVIVPILVVSATLYALMWILGG